MTKQRRTFTPEFKREAACLVLDQGYSHAEAARSLGLVDLGEGSALSCLDVGGEALIVSQFTLAAEIKGNRPGFSSAAAPESGCRLYERFSAQVAAAGVKIANGRFGADMQVELVNDGPVTIVYDADA